MKLTEETRTTTRFYQPASDKVRMKAKTFYKDAQIEGDGENLFPRIYKVKVTEEIGFAYGTTCSAGINRAKNHDLRNLTLSHAIRFVKDVAVP